MDKAFFTVTGMSCAACSRRVEQAARAVPGVAEASVNLLKNSLAVRYAPDATPGTVGAGIVAAVSAAGYGAHPRQAAGKGRANTPANDPVHDPAAEAAHRLRWRVALSALFAAPLLLVAMGPMLGIPLPLADNPLAWALTQFLLTVPIVGINFDYYRLGIASLLRGAPTMDALIALGSGAAAIFGVYALYRMSFALAAGDAATLHHYAHHLYFESAGVILTLITLGKYLEARAKGKTSAAIARLMDLAPKVATRLNGNVEESVPLEDVAVGDLLVVKTGGHVPVDGVITAGNGLLDESAITGESLPVEKQTGDTVTGATINTAGHFVLRATRVGDDTTLAQIIRLVDAATSGKAPIARLADSISGVFVPVVMGIALAATLVWLGLGKDWAFALSIGISVLVISCPCALGLATPTAIMVGTGRGAASGILLKSAEAVEMAGRVQAVVLDKTGTLTTGQLSLTDIIPTAGNDADSLLACAAALERLSEHPLGACVAQAAAARPLALPPVEDFAQTAGQGVSGKVGGVPCAVGNAALLAALGLDNPLAERAAELAATGKTPLYCVRDGQLLGLLALADTLKPGSREAVAAFRRLGLSVTLLTGDNARTAAHMAEQAGIDTVIAEVLPQDKEREIRRLQEAGLKVAMVGDGINDAPALARADVGIALGAGTDIAMESADVVLMKNDLRDAVAAIELSRAVLGNIRQNLFWAFFYNSVGIPVAAGVFYGLWGWTLNPMIAAAAMSLSSVSVVSNALRLRLFTPSLAVTRDTTPHNPARRDTMIKVLTVEGMNCKHCSASVEKALRAVPGVSGANVDLAAKKATVEADAAVTDAQLTQAVVDAGFGVTGIQ